MSIKLLPRIVTVAVAAAACAMLAAQGQAVSAAQQPALDLAGTRLVAHLASPAALGLPAEGYAAAPLPSVVVSSSSSFAAASALALPPVSAQFESIFVVPCRAAASTTATNGPEIDSQSADGSREPCAHAPDPATYARFLDSPAPSPLSSGQKGWLAVHDVKDPGNLATIFSTAAFTVAANPHGGFGPGMAGFGRASTYSLSQDATQEFFATFAVSSLAHEDPRYHREPSANVPRRLLHAVGHTFVAQSDSGRAMPNFATLAAYPIGAEIGNLYVPGLQTDGRSTADRILTAYATDPVDNLITEFLPDVARHVHVRVIFAQRILNEVSSDDFVLP